MGWTVYVANATAAATAWPSGAVSITWGSSTAIGFYSDGSGTSVTVNTFQNKSALIQSTTDPTVTRYINNMKYLSDTGYSVSTPGMGSDYYYSKASTDLSSPRPAYGTKWAFSTSGSVSFTQASAWWGAYTGVTVSGDSSDTGVMMFLSEQCTSQGWTYNNISTGKKSLNTYQSYRQALPTATNAQWFLGWSVRPKSTGAKQFAVAIDITYS